MDSSDSRTPMDSDDAKVQQDLVTKYPIPLPAMLHCELTQNEIGGRRVFIVGDVHGCLDELKELLATTGVTVDNTLIVFCGDLINKGPKSCETLAFIRSLGPAAARSVRGNHDERVLYECLRSPDEERDPVQRAKYAWVSQLTSEDVEYLRQLPYTISIPLLGCIVVHAGLVPDVPLASQRPIDMAELRDLPSVEDLKIEERSKEVVDNVKFVDDVTVIGGTKLEDKIASSIQRTNSIKIANEIGQITDAKTGDKPKDDLKRVAWASVWRGPQHVYFGHDAARMLQEHEHATGLDTGCVYGGQLTGVMICVGDAPGARNYFAVKAHDVYSPDTRAAV